MRIKVSLNNSQNLKIRRLSEPTVFEEVLGAHVPQNRQDEPGRNKDLGAALPQLPERGRFVNIQNVEICNEYNDKYYAGLPKIFFEVHKKFEKDLWGKSVVFHDKFGKELFKCNNVRIEWRFYEMYGSSRKDKVQFSATNLEFENLGAISHHYLSKILGKCCNVKHKKFNRNNVKKNSIQGPPLIGFSRKNQLLSFSERKLKSYAALLPPPIRHKRRYRYMRAWAAVMAVGRYCILYRFMKTFRYVFKTIHNKLVTIRPQSTAPT